MPVNSQAWELSGSRSKALRYSAKDRSTRPVQ